MLFLQHLVSLGGVLALFPILKAVSAITATVTSAVTEEAIDILTQTDTDTPLLRGQDEEPRVIGIDLATNRIYVTEYSISTGVFSTLGVITPSHDYQIFMWEIYLRHETDRQNWLDAWHNFRTCRYRITILSLRNLLGGSALTAWATNLLPDVMRDEDFRYPFNDDLDVPVTTNDGKCSSAGLVGSETDPTRKPLSNANFVEVLAEELKRAKTTALEKYGVNITFAAISTPFWIRHDLVEQAGTKANIELYLQMMRTDAAITLARHWGSEEPAVIEQSETSFTFHRPSSSRGEDSLGQMFIPNELLNQVLTGKHLNGTPETLQESTFRLRAEIVLQLAHFWMSHTPGASLPEVSDTTPAPEDKAGLKIFVVDFGQEGFDIDEFIPASAIRSAEARFVQAVEKLVAQAVLKFDNVWDHMARSASGVEVDEGCDDLPDPEKWETAFAFAKSHPMPTDESWWEPVDALLALADFPYNLLITTGAMRSLVKIPGSKMICMEDPERGKCLFLDLAARGAALEAVEHVREKERLRRWEWCSAGKLNYCTPEELDWMEDEEAWRKYEEEEERKNHLENLGVDHKEL